ncbi:hypothetical protein LCGC14_2939800 [marine sediment metagenome]|uniref:Uncharacterized protein n=1 Tax=marine sediment metagenome TaxID=412755 RepID=A0A0F9A9I2_9ZZZZ
MLVITNKIGYHYVVTGIWLCKKEVRRLLNGEDIGLIVYAEPPKSFQQSITVHMHKVGEDNGIYVEGLDDSLIASLDNKK